MSTKTLVFIHIPKCAGTSLGRLLTAAFPKHTFWHGHTGLINEEILKQSSRDLLERYRFIGGHFTLPMVERLLDQPGNDTMLVSLVRRPSEQTWSYYQWIKARPDHPLNSLCSPHSLPEALKDTSILQELSNIQSRYLLGPAVSAKDIPTKTMALLHRANVKILPVTQAEWLLRSIIDFMPDLRVRGLPSELPVENRAKTSHVPKIADLEAISEITDLDSLLFQSVLDTCIDSGSLTKSCS